MESRLAFISGGKASFIWIIEDFRNWARFSDRLQSARFAADDAKSLKWSVILSSSQKTWYSISINLQADNNDANYATFLKCSIIDAKLRLRNEEYTWHLVTHKCNACTFNNFIKIDEFLNEDCDMLFGGNLILYFEVHIEDTSANREGYRRIQHKVTENLAVLLHTQKFADFVVQVKDKMYPCHKCVLSCRSEYFSAMLRHNMKESIENKLTLTDVETDIFEKVLHYIYTGEAKMDESEAFQLYLAADKFGLKRLKLLCEQKLISCLCPSNAREIFTFASVYELKRLEMIAFIIVTYFLKPVRRSFLNKSHTIDEEHENNSKTGVGEIDAKREISNELQMKTSGKWLLTHRLNQVTGEKRMVPPKADFWQATDCNVFVEGVWPIKNFKKHCTSDLTLLNSLTVIADEEIWQISILKVLRDTPQPFRVPPTRVPLSQSPNAIDKVYELHLQVKLLSNNERNNASVTGYIFSILNKNYEETNIVGGIHNNSLLQVTANINLISVKDISSKSDLLHGSDLILRYSFRRIKHKFYDCSSQTIPVCDLGGDIASLLQDKSFADTTVRIKNDTILCHKAILAGCSPFFASKFEKDLGVVIEIDDIEPMIFAKVLSTIYGGKCELTLDEVLELVPLEEKYHFFNTSVFDDALTSLLSVENVCKALELADCHNVEKVKRFALEFIVENFEEVIKSSFWFNRKRHEHLINACLNEYVLH